MDPQYDKTVHKVMRRAVELNLIGIGTRLSKVPEYLNAEKRLEGYQKALTKTGFPAHTEIAGRPPAGNLQAMTKRRID